MSDVMFHRILRIAMLVAGIAIVLFGMYQWINTPAIVQLIAAERMVAGDPVDTSFWSKSYYFWNGLLICAGVAVIAAGANIERNRKAAYFLLAIAAALVIAGPLVHAQTRFSQYMLDALGSAPDFNAYTMIVAIVIAFVIFNVVIFTIYRKHWNYIEWADTDRYERNRKLLEVRRIYGSLFWIYTAGLVTFCVAFGTPFLSRIPANALLRWGGCTLPGFDTAGSCPAGSFLEPFADSLLGLSSWLVTMFSPIILIVGFGGILLVWLAACVFLGVVSSMIKAKITA